MPTHDCWSDSCARMSGRAAAQVAPPAPSDVDAGRGLFEGKGQCLSCHRVLDAGGRTARELSWIGLLRTPDKLRAAVTNPSTHPSASAFTPAGGRSTRCLSAYAAHAVGAQPRPGGAGNCAGDRKCPVFQPAAAGQGRTAGAADARAPDSARRDGGRHRVGHGLFHLAARASRWARKGRSTRSTCSSRCSI